MDFSCLHCVGVSADGEARVMTDMLMCLTGRAQCERGRETAATDRQTAKREDENDAGAVCHWQRDLRRHSDRCTVMNPALGETHRCLFRAHSQSVHMSYCLAYFPLLCLSHTLTDL